MKKIFFLFSSMVFLLSTCTKDKGQVPATVTVTDTTDNCNYTDTIADIVNTNCAISGCHQMGSSNGDLSSYSAVKLYIDNGLFKQRVLVDQDMPTSPVEPLSDLEKSKISCWIDGGALETGSAAVNNGLCATTVSYATTIAPIIATNCTTNSGCHGTGSVNGDYTVHAGLLSKVSNGSLNTRVVVVKDMATFPILSTPLTSTEISNIDCWIQQGGLNN